MSDSIYVNDLGKEVHPESVGVFDGARLTWTPPKTAGYWKIGGDWSLNVEVAARPNWLHRKMTKIFFGWDWIDS